MHVSSRGEGGILVNKDGYRYLQDYDLGQPLDVNDPNHPQKRAMELGPRDRLSQAFVAEREKGRTIEGRYGHVVHLDLRHMGEKAIDKKIPFVRELCRNYVGIDPVHELVPVRPVVHYCMGGVSTNIEGETTLPGLLAAGECGDLQVLMDASELEEDDYFGNISLASNDPATPLIEAAVVFHVGIVDAIAAEVHPESLNVSSNGIAGPLPRAGSGRRRARGAAR